MTAKIKKLLIANRGEIACRVISAAKALGIKTVAVYSDADQNSLHCQLADQAFYIGPAPAKQSYLKTENILEVAKKAQVDAIHPGYGFLAENSNFARSVIANNILWVGPHPNCIDAMGDKDSARKLARAANVPVLHGSVRFQAAEVEDLQSMAHQVGYPLLVKATAGGGGIGMKLVESEASLEDIVMTTANLAEQAFGDGTLYLERHIKSARHIEIQIFGFGDNKAVHLFERECSIQRRFQKIIEESPAPNIPTSVVSKMADAAVNLAQQQNYQGAGTVEFVLDSHSEEFFFLEMNTRIQVEHPVTEMISGLDLVQMQILQAAGDQPILEQSDISRNGAALECRLYAEDPSFHFLPSPGTLSEFSLPVTEEARVDTGYQHGDQVSIHYDPMLAKLITWGETRELASEKMQQLLEQSNIQGCKNNREFLQSTLKHPQYIAGNIYTKFVDEHLDSLI